MNQHFLEKCQIAAGFAPVDMSASSGPTSDWFNMALFGRCAVVLVAAVGTNGQDTTITLEQATSNGGTPKNLTFDRIDVKQGTDLFAIGQFTPLENTDHNYTHADSGEQQLIWVIDVKAEDLDAENGYSWIRASVNDHGAAKVGTILYIGHEPRYSTVPLPSAIE